MSLVRHESVGQRLRSTLAEIRHLDLTDRVSYADDSGFHAGGGFGDIRIGACEIAGRGTIKVAVKCVRLYIDRRAQIVKLVEKEVRVWSRLQHKNVLPLLGYSIDDNGLPSLISELMENGTAFQYVSAHPEFDVLPMILGIAEGVGYLHERGVIHSDLKADNVLISAQGEPLIIDFGISRMISISQTMAHMPSSTTNLRGTARWMSPELLMPPPNQSAAHTKESDVWAFGMTTYEILTKRRPYDQLINDGQVTFAIVDGILPEKPAKIKDWPIHYVKAWSVCEATWSKEPLLRPRIDGIIMLLENAISGLRSIDGDAENSSVPDIFVMSDRPVIHAYPNMPSNNGPREWTSQEARNDLPPPLPPRPLSRNLVLPADNLVRSQTAPAEYVNSQAAGHLQEIVPPRHHSFDERRNRGHRQRRRPSESSSEDEDARPSRELVPSGLHSSDERRTRVNTQHRSPYPSSSEEEVAGHPRELVLPRYRSSDEHRARGHRRRRPPMSSSEEEDEEDDYKEEERESGESEEGEEEEEDEDEEDEEEEDDETRPRTLEDRVVDSIKRNLPVKEFTDLRRTASEMGREFRQIFSKKKTKNV